MHLVYQTRIDTRFPSTIAVPWVASSSKPCFSSLPPGPPRVLYRLRARKATHDLFLHGGVAAQLRFGERFSEGRPTPMTSPVERISGPNSGSTPGIY